MAIHTFQIGTPRRRGEGLRLGTVRYLPRGVKKHDYARLDYFDVWMPLLAPSRELLTEFQKRLAEDDRALRQFFARYRRELLRETETRQTLSALARLGAHASFAIGCYCEDETRCHRSELMKVLRELE